MHAKNDCFLINKPANSWGITGGGARAASRQGSSEQPFLPRHSIRVSTSWTELSCAFNVSCSKSSAVSHHA
jgi:hypothetical protein